MKTESLQVSGYPVAKVTRAIHLARSFYKATIEYDLCGVKGSDNATLIFTGIEEREAKAYVRGFLQSH